MPSALLRSCPGDGGTCPELVEHGLCAKHARARDSRRGSAAKRGYNHRWQAFRERFVAMLVAVGIAPVCGASLPGGPGMAASLCRQQGLINGRRLHLHHDPPLRDDERTDQKAVCDPLRVGFLCEQCHNTETAREQRTEIR